MSVTLPVLVIRNEYVTLSPALPRVIGSAVLSTVIAGAGVLGTLAESGGESIGVFDPAGVPWATAVLSMTNWSGFR